MEQKAILLAKTYNRLKELEIENPEPTLKLAPAILEAAADEDREELQELWEGLLAAAMDPTKQNLVRQSLISTVKKMDAFDALVLKLIAEHGESPWVPPMTPSLPASSAAESPLRQPDARDEIARRLQAPTDDVVVSLNNLGRLSLISLDAFLAPLGKLLMRAIA